MLYEIKCLIRSHVVPCAFLMIAFSVGRAIAVNGTVQITSPGNNDRFTFSSASAGVCEIPSSAEAIPSNLTDRIRWRMESIDGSNLATVPDPPVGGNVTFRFTGLPANNSEFGPKVIRASLPAVRTMTFEDGTDGARIRSTIPGMFFTTTQGYDWIYGDKRTGRYNVDPYGTRSYVCHGNVFAWLGPNQGQGRIDFTGSTGSKISLLTSTYSGLWLRAYDNNGQLLNSDYSPPNTGTYQLTQLTVSGANIAYVLVHDAGNYWLIDDLSVEDLLADAESFLADGEESGMQILDVIDMGVTISQYFNNPRVGILHIILHWFGSEMILTIYEPDGSVYGQWQTDFPPIDVTISPAMAGQWQFEITAIDIPEDDYPYALVVGTAEAPEDITPPVITIHSPVDGKRYFNSSPVHFSFSAEDPESDISELTAILNEVASVEDGQDTLLTDLGYHHLQVIAVNGVGLADTASVTFIINRFQWIKPITYLDSLQTETIEIIKNSTLPIKFSVFDSSGAFIPDTTVHVVLEGTSADFHYGQCDTCVRIDLENPEEPKYITNMHTNFRHWDYGIQIGEPYWLKTFLDDILAHKARVVVVNPHGLQRASPPIPEAFSLFQNYPNPFNAQTTIEYALPEPADVEIAIYNLAGQKIETVLREHRPAGYHKVIWDTFSVSSGVYFYKIYAGDFTKTKKMLLLK